MHGIAVALLWVTGAAPTADQSGGMDALWRPSPARSRRVTGTHQSLPAGQERVLANLEGPGVIRHVWFTAALHTADEIARFHRGVVIRAYWDEERTPSVEVPFGDFFAVGHGVQRPFQCAVLSMTPYKDNVRAGFNCYFAMPFKKRARLVLHNQMTSEAKGVYWHVDYDLDPSVSGDVMTFHATYRSSRPVTREVPHVMCDAEGRGKYVGTVWSVHLLAAHSWVESREDFYLDGGEEPALPGTGSEDYYGQAWGYRPDLQTHYLGTSVHVDKGFGRWTAYRFHLLDPIVFQKSIRVTMKDRGYNIGYRTDDFSTVTYWYQLEPHKAHPPLPGYEDRLPVDHVDSYAHGLGTLRDLEAKGDAAGAVRAANLLASRYPKNPLADELACRRADLLERAGQVDQAKAELRKLVANSAQPAAVKAAEDKLWMLERPGRALLKAYAPSGIEVFLDGQSVHKAGPWNMRDLVATRVEVGKGKHLLAAHAICLQDQPFRYLRLGTLQLWLDLPGADLRADKTWKISPKPVDGWNKPGLDDARWPAAVEHAGLPDEAWFRLSGPGLRAIPYPLKRVWSANCNPFHKERGPCFEHLYARCEVEVP